MMNIDGLIYLQNEAGLALIQSQQRIAELEAENARLRAAQEPTAASQE